MYMAYIFHCENGVHWYEHISTLKKEALLNAKHLAELQYL